MNWDSYFTDGDKPYSENLNDSLVLTDAFDISVPVEMPTMFSNGEFNSSLNVTRKCNVGLVTLKSVDSGVTVGADSISGTGSVVFRIYPNFNCFYKWDKIIVEKSGTVDISFRKVDGTEITANVGSDGSISDNNALKQLQEIDVVFTLSSATISNILIWFVNNQGTRNRTGARLEASQLVNVNGTVTANDDKAVNGGTVKTALDSLHSTVTGEMEDLKDSITGETNAKLESKEDKSNKVTVLDSNSSHYPSCTAVNTGLALKEMLSNKVTSLDSSDSHYPSSKAVKTITDALSTDLNSKFKWILKSLDCLILKTNVYTFQSSSSPFTADGDVLIDWGDGSDLEVLNGRMKHSYSSSENHTIRVYGHITKLNENCFNGCTGLISINIPRSITHFAGSVLSNCTNLSSIYLNSVYSSEIQSYQSSWLTNSNNAQFYIPIGTKSVYTAKGYPSNKLVE